MRVGDVTEAHGKRYLVTRVEHTGDSVNVHVRELPTAEGMAALHALAAEWEAVGKKSNLFAIGEQIIFRECASELKATLAQLTQTTQTTD